jgi:hypothetical protein
MKLPRERQTRLERLAAMPDESIDTSDIPEVLDWSGAIRGTLHRSRRETAMPSEPIEPDSVEADGRHRAR